MKINWKVRFKNPVFWLNLAASIVLPILAYLGLSWQDMTSYEALGGVLLQAVQNPVILVAVLVSVWNALNDPTTQGIGDSDRAMTYEKPAPKGYDVETIKTIQSAADKSKARLK